ncbi:proline-rich protein 18 [Sturnira hondurensis]|uniref:proline-rich protein 18 n=1 Tax=Sturnira hondurensis TaxID=192404 RepID=UPI00187977B2|nr:proline-rich protein 18 [Sturnira hondurensis]
MPFPPPPASAPRVFTTRQSPRRPWKTAAPTCAPLAPLPPAATREKQQPPARPEVLSRSWPSATLRKPPARRAPGLAPRRAPAPAGSGSGSSPAGAMDIAASGLGRAATARFPLSLTPEATPALQRRRLEQQLLVRPRRLLPVPLANATLPLGPGPRAKGTGPRRGGSPGGLDGHPPGVPLPPCGRRAPDPGPRPADLRRVLKVSLLNDRHKYDDVEYEEEAVAVDEGLVRRCTEWLRGVEAAAASRNHTRALDVLPHLSTL